ncbi:methylmalonyl-CoA mutase family protein [Hyphomicrobium sulfonivorans]|uniref:methylmalonyl-CoA mutase family protein n=1 Tax=Hyphomicrobium sulfonivorans TaxID=121290 RepID=UPI00156D4398|nr:methylmalonyl-CoA mutase family protein [Hyphomicrobium sulfonivorans]MBI1649667.1 methylmalonyl-CoA mutase [Hyphomicrobium sulfonivorans]NSL71582.1 methylmalonyl-CoA mutase [Hyphomicrobium sulfonivorans]
MTETTAPIDLASGFDPVSFDTWRQLVDKALKGADYERRLVAKTADGLRIDPIYTRADALAGVDGIAPGGAPFTRGTSESAQDLGWQIHQRVVEADPAAANKVIMDELDGGANGLVLQIAGPGQNGIRITSVGDAATCLPGVYVDYAPIQLVGGIGGLQAAKHFLGALAAIKKEEGGTAVSRLNVDPVGTFARYGSTWAPIETALAETVAFAREAAQADRPISSVLVDATVPHEAGASEAQELAFLAAALVTYLRAFEAAGVSAKDAFPQIAFALSVDTDLFLNAAKVRAARTIIARIAEASGASAAELHITAITSSRMMAKRDPWTNMLRTTAACAAAAFGGANAITVLPYTWVLGLPDRFARRIARNTQLVLQEESQLGRVVDPLGGSWYVEKLTNDLAQKAWGLFQDIEAKGGLIAVLSSGALQDDIAKMVEARTKAVATGRQELTGVSVFPFLGNDGVKVTPYPQVDATGAAVSRPLTPHRTSEAFEALRDAGDAFEASTGKRKAVFMANLGEIAEHNRRSQWMWNFLAAGGIEGLTSSEGYKSADEAAADFKASGATVACICSSDEVYARDAEAVAKALKAAGAQQILLAGKPGELEAALRTAGVNDFIFAGQNAVEVLGGLHKTIG